MSESRTAASGNPALRRAEPAEAGELSHVIALAFADLDVSRWLVADPEVRRDIFPDYYRIFVEHALSAGLVHTTADRDAVALWLPAGTAPPDPPHGYVDRLAEIAGAWMDRFLIFDEILEQAYPAGKPHHHLAMVAVRPERQRRGVGEALLRSHHATLDAAGLPAYLEASSLLSRQLYLRLDYADVGPPIQLPSGPCLYPMWRVPANGD